MVLHPLFHQHVAALREVFETASRVTLHNQRPTLGFNLGAIASFADPSASDVIEQIRGTGVALFLAVERGEPQSTERARTAALRAVDVLEAELAKGRLNENAAGIGF